MVNDLKQLLRDNVADAPADHLDLGSVVAAGRARVRRRQHGVVAGTAAAVAAVLLSTTLGLPGSGGGPGPADRPSLIGGPEISLADAVSAVEGRDYRILSSVTNRGINGEYVDGVTDDGLVLVRDAARQTNHWRERFALVDPATGDRDWLPDPGLGQDPGRPVELGRDRLVLLTDNGIGNGLSAYVFDRSSRTWMTTTWPTLSQWVDFDQAGVGPGGRLYLRVLISPGPGQPDEWPLSPDALDADGATFHLWSVSLTDGDDVRDEGLTVGDVAFSDRLIAWTDSVGDDRVLHIRDTTTGEEHSFDPRRREDCSASLAGAFGDRLVVHQRCDSDDGVAVVSASGTPVMTIHGSSLDGWLASGSGVVVLSGGTGKQAATYLYEVTGGQLLRISNDASDPSEVEAAAPAGAFVGTTWSADHGSNTQWAGQLLH